MHEGGCCPWLTLDGDDELRDDGQDLGAAVFQHVMDSLASQDLIRMGGLAQAVEKQRQEVVVVQLVDLYLRVEIHICVRGVAEYIFNLQSLTDGGGRQSCCPWLQGIW